ncbi:MAG: hypothetical protein JW751_22675 [Polyangiaceae bacterium]|nr:hypothetical protein [Polyangiaceae bacterium]
MRILAATLAFLGTVVWAGNARAYPWMMKHGHGGCSGCHVDPSGGELLTELGRSQAYVWLAMPYGRARTTGPTEPLWGRVRIPHAVEVSGSYRHLSLLELGDDPVFASFPMQADLYAAVRAGPYRAGGSIGVAEVPVSSPHARAAQLTGVDADYVNLLSRHHWVGFAPSRRTLLRAGRLNLPYGLRIPEHTAWVRDQTRTDRESDQAHGVALSFDGPRLRGELMAILGNYQLDPDQYRERGFAGFVEWRANERLGLGWSSLAASAGADWRRPNDDPWLRAAHGLFARAVFGRGMTLIAEVDATHTSLDGVGYVGFVQVDLELTQGLHFLGTGETLLTGHQPQSWGPPPTAAGEPRYGGWLSIDWYFLPQMSARIDGIARQDEPFTFYSQLHVYL